jgi:phosphate:Na+ symporter
VRHHLDAETLYQRHIKGVYGDLLSFMGRLEVTLDEAHQQFWVSCQVTALQLVDAVKDAKHLQKNLGHYLEGGPSATRDAYVELRRHLLATLHQMRELSRSQLPDEVWSQHLQWLDEKAADFDGEFRNRLFAAVRSGQLDGLQMSSLMNDLGYASRIIQSLRNVLMIGQRQGLLRAGASAEEEEGLIELP